MSKVTVSLNPQEREGYLNRLLALDGLSHITEDALAAYCPISLTNTPNELKSFIEKRQEILMTKILAKAGITAYNPSSAPYSPDKNLDAQPNEVYVVDSGKIAGARFFVGHNILPSTGQGIEAEKAKTLNRMVVIFMDKNIRVSRMQPHRAIYLHYDNFEEEAEKFVPLFKYLTQFDPGMGFQDGLPVLVGFEINGNCVVNLEAEISKQFPDLVYKYNNGIDIVQTKVNNPEIFYENH